MSSIPQKACSLCGEIFPETLEYFSVTPYGLRADCRECQRARARKRYWADPEKHKQQSRDYRQTPEGKAIHSAYSKEWRKANPDKVKASKKRDYEKHKEKRLATMRRNYPKNKAAIMARGKDWKKRNPEKVKADTLKRIIRKRNLPMNYRAADWLTALEYFGHKCAVCGYDCSNPNDNRVLAQDHWIPMEYKGDDNPGTVPTNIIPLCHGTDGCNNLKHDFMPDVYLAKYFSPHEADAIIKRVLDYFEWIKTHS